MRLALGQHPVVRLARFVRALRRGNLGHTSEAGALANGIEHHALGVYQRALQRLVLILHFTAKILRLVLAEPLVELLRSRQHIGHASDIR